MLNKCNYVKISIEWYGDRMKSRNVPTKNYLILTFISLATLFIVFYLVSWYNTSKEYYQNNSILVTFLSELKSDEITSYLIDNPQKVIYYAAGKDEKIKGFEKQFKKLIEEEEIKNAIIYVDSSKEENNSFVANISKIYDKNLDSMYTPNLIYISEGKVKRILYSSESEISKRDVRNFLIKCGIITND